MSKRLAAAALVVALATAGLTGASSTHTESAAPIGLARIVNAYQPNAIVTGIATFDTVPSAARVDALRGLGLMVQPMKHLPLASVQGPVTALKAAVAHGAANDVYPNEKYEYFDKESSDSMGAAALRAKGYTGKGVTVAVVDSGCDATHPDLADHVTHNVKVLSGEYVNLPPDSSNTLPLVMSDTPYSNTDPTSGHGTYVAGIIAADGTSDPSHVGVAPDAELVCIAVGEGIFTTAVVTAYDYLLDQPELWGVDVINNSWGNSFYMFDPRHPVHVATKAMADQGVVIVFAAGNSGDANAEMSTSTFSTAPWVLGIAAADVQRRRSFYDDEGELVGAFSSNGLMFDNARPLPIGKNGYRGFKRNRLGMYHPDLTAPGVLISSSCASTGGAAVGPCGPAYGNETASGTSAASPHVAGAAAVLLQANPALSWLQVQQAMQATAIPDVYNVDENGKRTRLGYWQAGYGFVNLNAAVQLVTSKDWASALAARQRAADRRLLRSIGYTVARSDMWQYDAPRVSLFGSDTRTFRKQVATNITRLKVTLAHPSLYAVGMNEMVYSVTVRDAAGNVLGTTEEAAAGHGTSSLFVDLTTIKNVAYGAFTFEVVGELAVSDPDNIDSESLLGRVVVLQVAQLVPLRR